MLARPTARKGGARRLAVAAPRAHKFPCTQFEQAHVSHSCFGQQHRQGQRPSGAAARCSSAAGRARAGPYSPSPALRRPALPTTAKDQVQAIWQIKGVCVPTAGNDQPLYDMVSALNGLTSVPWGSGVYNENYDALCASIPAALGHEGPCAASRRLRRLQQDGGAPAPEGTPSPADGSGGSGGSADCSRAKWFVYLDTTDPAVAGWNPDDLKVSWASVAGGRAGGWAGWKLNMHGAYDRRQQGHDLTGGRGGISARPSSTHAARGRAEARTSRGAQPCSSHGSTATTVQAKVKSKAFNTDDLLPQLQATVSE